MRFTTRDLLRTTATVGVGLGTILFGRRCTDVPVELLVGSVLLFMGAGLLFDLRWGGMAGAGVVLAMLLLLIVVSRSF